jgi:hypothetical protein
MNLDENQTMSWLPELESLRFRFTVLVRTPFIFVTLLRPLTRPLCSIVAVIAGALLPRLTQRDTRLLAHEGDEDEDAEFTRLRATVMEWRAEAARKGQPLKLPFMPFFLRNIWTGAMLLFAVITLSTFFITKVWQVCVYTHDYKWTHTQNLCRPLSLSAWWVFAGPWPAGFPLLSLWR